MRVLLDCRFHKGAGPNVTAVYLLDHLIKLNTEHEFVILQHQGQPIPNYPGVEKIMVPTRNMLLEFLWVQTYLPWLLKRRHIDLYHSLKHIGPLFTRVPTILYLREVGHFFSEGDQAFKLNSINKFYWTTMLIFALRRARHIIGISQETKDVITQKFGIPPSRVSVNYHGLDQKFKIIHDAEAIEECKRRYHLPDRYILCVSNLYPHKNYDTVVKMLAELRAQVPDAPKLVVVGDRSYAGAEFFDLIKQLGLEDWIVFTNYVQHDDLVYIYNGAALLLYPPIVGSFGNPPLEAMACGIPVIVSDRGALPEVTGGAALLLQNPTDVDEMLVAVRRVLEEQHVREALLQKGLQRIHEFSWEKSAQRVLAIYEKVGKSINRSQLESTVKIG